MKSLDKHAWATAADYNSEYLGKPWVPATKGVKDRETGADSANPRRFYETITRLE
jgi:hypothetical protein